MIKIKQLIHATITISAISLCSAQTTSKNLTSLKEEKLPFIKAVEVYGEKPKVIYVPIVHDGPNNHIASNKLTNLRKIMKECESIAEHLYKNHEVKNILLEGCGKGVADVYKKMEGTTKKLNFARTKMLVFKTWGNILNARRWTLAYTTDKPTYGPLSVLGAKYDKRIKNALSSAHRNGWFRTRENFDNNLKEFNKSISDAIAGYNEKRAKILKEDPLLKREYEMIVTARNKNFIKHITEKDGPGIIMCGSGHLHDLKKQMQKDGTSFMVVVPNSIKWPNVEKTEKEIYTDMLGQGAKLKSCNITFANGTPHKITIPID